jgi:peroxiredoxin
MLKDNTGSKIPSINFKIQKNHQWINLSTEEIFNNKTVVVFALPGAYTPTCSSSHLPRYNELAPVLKANGVDEVVCVSVNDTFVMNAWSKDQEAENILMIPDGSGEFTRDMDMLVFKPAQNFGYRSWRYAMVVEDMEIENMFIEDGKNQMGLDDDPYEVTKPENILRNIV